MGVDGRKEDIHADVVIALQSTCCVRDRIKLNTNVGELMGAAQEEVTSSERSGMTTIRIQEPRACLIAKVWMGTLTCKCSEN